MYDIAVVHTEEKERDRVRLAPIESAYTYYFEKLLRIRSNDHCVSFYYYYYYSSVYCKNSEEQFSISLDFSCYNIYCR